MTTSTAWITVKRPICCALCIHLVRYATGFVSVHGWSTQPLLVLWISNVCYKEGWFRQIGSRNWVFPRVRSSFVPSVTIILAWLQHFCGCKDWFCCFNIASRALAFKLIWSRMVSCRSLRILLFMTPYRIEFFRPVHTKLSIAHDISLPSKLMNFQVQKLDVTGNQRLKTAKIMGETIFLHVCIYIYIYIYV
jgi:hypothetical protein